MKYASSPRRSFHHAWLPYRAMSLREYARYDAAMLPTQHLPSRRDAIIDVQREQRMARRCPWAREENTTMPRCELIFSRCHNIRQRAPPPATVHALLSLFVSLNTINALPIQPLPLFVASLPVIVISPHNTWLNWALSLGLRSHTGVGLHLTILSSLIIGFLSLSLSLAGHTHTRYGHCCCHCS